jgi:phage head maturation protease
MDYSNYYVKSIGPDRIAGLALIFGNQWARDLSDEYFTKNTKGLLAVFEVTRAVPLLYEHAGDPILGAEPVGVVDLLKIDPNAGVWFEAALNSRFKYLNLLKELIARGVLSISSGTLPRARVVNKSGEILSWALSELSLTTRPAEPALSAHPVSVIKSILSELNLGFLLTGAPVIDRTIEIEIEKERLALLDLSAIDSIRRLPPNRKKYGYSCAVPPGAYYA